jgi:hypothetical protein
MKKRRSSVLEDKMNEKMAEYVPELDSEYAATPLSLGKWRRPSDVLDDGTHCFVRYAGNLSQLEETAQKRDYIWIPGDVHKELLAGYYHLSTKEAYLEIHRRVSLKEKERKSENLANALKLKFRSKDRKEEDKISRKVVQLIKLRMSSLYPDDIHSYRMHLLKLTPKEIDPHVTNSGSPSSSLALSAVSSVW